jgi:hypothetical protein
MAACATTSPPVHSDLRQRTAVSSPAPQLLVTGPVRLLHANYDRRAGVTFFKAVLADGASAIDCKSGALVGWDGETDLEVREGEGVCVAAAREVNLLWHARTGVSEPQQTQQAKR